MSNEGSAISAPDVGAATVAGGRDAARWREAAQLRSARPHWVIIWLAPAGEFRAYRRLPGTRRDTTVSAATAEDLAEAIQHAEQGNLRSRNHEQGQP